MAVRIYIDVSGLYFRKCTDARLIVRFGASELYFRKRTEARLVVRFREASKRWDFSLQCSNR